MPYFVIAVIFVAFAYSGPAYAEGDFPELKLDGSVPEGFALRLQDGPDFYIWRCELSSAPRDSVPGFGIYFGLHPSLFQPEAGATHHAGSVGGEPLLWRQWREGKNLRREAVFDYRYSPKHLTLKLHVFITARSEAELDALVQALAHLKFTARNPNAA
jgi:hypothetical protein